MSRSIVNRSIIAPTSWQDLPNGEQLQACVQQALAPWWPRLFGYHLLKLGPLSGSLDASNCSISHQVSLFDGMEASVVGDVSHLPLRHASIDVVITNFLLEFESNPYQFLREIDRVLISGGTLVITGFNPLSPALLGKLLPKYQHQIPWRGHFYLPSRIKDWLALLGYQVICDDRMIYHPLFGDFNKASFWQHSLASWLPRSGSLYFMVARKLDSPLSPILEKRKARKTKWQAVPTTGRVHKE